MNAEPDPSVSPQLARTLGWCNATERCQKYSAQYFTWMVLISLFVTFLKIVSGLIQDPERLTYVYGIGELLNAGTFLCIIYGATLFLGLTTVLFKIVRSLIILFGFGKFSLSFLIYNQLVLGTTVFLALNLPADWFILPLTGGCTWLAMILAVIHEADPNVMRGNPPYFIAKRMAEERMKRRAKRKVPAEKFRPRASP